MFRQSAFGKKAIAFVSVLVLSVSAFAHEEPAAGHDDFNLEATLDLYQKIVDLTPLITAENASPSLVSPKMTYGGKTIYLNSHFWELVSGWLRIYHDEVKRDCPDCPAITQAEMLKSAQDYVAKGGFETKVIEPIKHSAEHIILSTADLGAQLGTTVAVAKATAEVAETVGSKFIGGGGVHIFCTVIDAVIVFGARHMQTWHRVPSFGATFDQSKFMTFARFMGVRRAMKRAQNRVQFIAGPVAIDEEGIEDVDHEGPRRWWGKAHEGKREMWIKKFQEHSASLQAQIEDLDSKIDEESNPKALKKFEKQKASLEDDLGKAGQLGVKQFYGKRYGLLFFLKDRKWMHQNHLAGNKNFMDKSLSKPLMWIMAVQENILNRSLISDPNDPKLTAWIRKMAEQKPNYGIDDIRRGLAEEFVQRAQAQEGPLSQPHVEQVDRILMDIDRVFDPSFSNVERYLLVQSVESAMTGLLYKVLQKQIEETPIERRMWILQVWDKARLSWKVGRFANVFYQFSDFLRTAAISKNPDELFEYKHVSQEYFLRILSYLNETSEKMKDIEDSEDLKNYRQTLDKEYLKLREMKPWLEKRTSYTFLPFISAKAPRCEDLAKVEH